ncbi:MAG: hypothetical protein ACRC46_04215 [Thermoguttaceae bacterium]
MTSLIKQELNDEPFDQNLLACVELHLMRRVKYGTKIKISDATIQVTLSNIPKPLENPRSGFGKPPNEAAEYDGAACCPTRLGYIGGEV